MTADLLFEIVHGPVDDRDRLESLEPVLAAATLELDIDVLFRGAGAGHLAGPGSERWSQVIDFDLGRLWLHLDAVDQDLVESAVVEAERIGADEVEQLRRRARKIVAL